MRIPASEIPSAAGHKLLVLLPWMPSDESVRRIRAQFPDLKVFVHEVPWQWRLDDIDVPKDEWADATVLLTGAAFPTAEMAPKLAFVQLASAGANHVIENPLFTDTDIAFSTANGVHGPQISEWVISTFLASQHHLPKYLEFQREGKWNKLDANVQDSVGRRVGILGYGSIGRQVARVSKAMGMDVHAYTLHPRSTPESRRDKSYHPPGLGDPDGTLPSKWFSGESKADLHEFLGSGLDLLVISVPLTPQTRHLLSAAEFEVLSERKTFVSNIARGPIVNTDDLIQALESGAIRGAALDVTDPEPLPEGHPLWKAPNVIITPHISGLSTNYNDRVFAILEANLERFLKGEELMNRVSRKRGY